MNWLHDHLWKSGVFQWWAVIGWIGTMVFFSRFLVQWYATEKKKRVVVPPAFWWLSIVGSLLVLSYAIYRHDPVFIVSYAFTCIPYVRNLIIHRRHEDAHVECGSCGADCPPGTKFCSMCATPVAGAAQPSA